jgi:hypothetical protein
MTGSISCLSMNSGPEFSVSREFEELSEENVELRIFPIACVGGGGIEALFDDLIFVSTIEEHPAADDVHTTPCVEPLEIGMKGVR